MCVDFVKLALIHSKVDQSIHKRVNVMVVNMPKARVTNVVRQSYDCLRRNFENLVGQSNIFFPACSNRKTKNTSISNRKYSFVSIMYNMSTVFKVFNFQSVVRQISYDVCDPSFSQQA